VNDDRQTSELKCKLDAKCQALIILSEDLIACKQQRDEYKNLAEQLESRLNALRTRIHSLGPQVANLCEIDSSSFLFSKQSAKLKDSNRHLQMELDTLRVQLADAESDSKLLRDELRRVKKRVSHTAEVPMITTRNSDATEVLIAVSGEKSGSERISDHIANDPRTDSRSSESQRSDHVERLVEQLEHSQQKVKLLEKDVEAVLDEKEELIISRNEYKIQVEKLNERIKQLQTNSK
jgi:chromosome segregation ATPase